MTRLLPILLLLCSVFLYVSPNEAVSHTSGKFVDGFQGIPWGTSLDHITQVTLIDTSEQIKTYALTATPPTFEDIPVESVKLISIHNQFARVFIRYKGDQSHQSVMELLEGHFGKIDRSRGSMIRGLNQEYTWRGQTIQISVTYRGLREQGFLFLENRTLAPDFLDALTEQSH